MRLSLSNRFFAVSHQQFQNYCADFQAAVEHVMVSPFDTRASGYSRPIEYITIVHDDLQKMCEDRNAPARLFDSVPLKDVNEGMWDSAKYVEVVMKPLNDDDAPRSAFAHLEFKGHLPRTATFYAQPDESAKSLKDLMCQRYPGKIIGDGYAEHANSNTFMRGVMKVSPMAGLKILSRGLGL